MAIYDPETVLVFSSGTLLTVLVVMVGRQLFGLSLYSILTGQNMKFDSKRFPEYALALAATLALSMIYGYVISSDFSLTLQFTAINLGIVAVCCLNLILHRRS